MRSTAAHLHGIFLSATTTCLVSSYNELLYLDGRATALQTLMFWVLPLVLEREDAWTPSKKALISFLMLDLFMNSCTCGKCIHKAAWEPSVSKGFCNIPWLGKPGSWTRLQGRLCHSLFQNTNKQIRNPQPFDSSKCSTTELGVMVHSWNVS